MSEGFVTGIYVRIKRDDRYQSIDIAALTDAELETFFQADDAARSRKFAIGLAAWIRDHIVFVPETPTTTTPPEQVEQQMGNAIDIARRFNDP